MALQRYDNFQPGQHPRPLVHGAFYLASDVDERVGAMLAAIDAEREAALRWRDLHIDMVRGLASKDRILQVYEQFDSARLSLDALRAELAP